MSQLAPNLFDRRFDKLMEVGRAQIPALVPEWTDHNAHDPGITLMELLAWVAEAQLYSLSRVRRDERTAYAALLGIVPSGTESAAGIIWADRGDPDSPHALFGAGAVIPRDAVIRIAGTGAPIFTPQAKLLWMPGRIEKLETRGSRGSKLDHTRTNEVGGAAFLPFGENAGPRNVLAMTFSVRDQAGMFGATPSDKRGALWPIGVLVAPPLVDVARSERSSTPGRSPLIASLVTDDESMTLPIASDSTNGFLTTGAILLDLDNVTKSHKQFTIELRSRGGFACPPRILRIEPNVIPIQQGTVNTNEVLDANGMPDLTFALKEPGLKFARGEEPVTVEVSEGGRWSEWLRSTDVSEHGPEDVVYEFDLKTREIRFGNGVNGRVPPAGSPIRVTYKVSDGEEGNVARNRKWNVTGFAGVFGVNPDPIAGGTSASDFGRQRREARAAVRRDHALVTSSDIEAAATDLVLLEVARAWVVKPAERTPRTGIVTLVAVRSRAGDIEPDEPPETPRWLDSIRRQLVPRVPLGTRLVVKGPAYRDFSIHAAVEVYAGLDPTAIRKTIYDALAKRLSLIGPSALTPGVRVNKRDVAAWILKVEGVRRISELELRDANGTTTTSIKVTRSGLPRWTRTQSTFTVNRQILGRTR